MTRSFLIIVTGLPASGKTTLARGLAARHRVPLLAKDLVKEPLLDALGAEDALASRRLSDASFLRVSA
ncbi:MAG: AAA family ATPase [Steroidobacteraceae bacterium]